MLSTGSRLRMVILPLIWLGSLAAAATAEIPAVRLEIANASGGAVDGPQRWVRELQQLPFQSIRVRAARPGDQPQIEQRGSDRRPSFHVTAILTPRNELAFPDTVFRWGDRRRIREWLEQLTSAGNSTTDTGPFQLTEGELVALRRGLATPFGNPTRNAKVRSVVAQLQQRVRFSIIIDPGARARLSRAGTVEDELRGLAEGTVLAAVLRPAGLAFVPEKAERGRTVLRIVAAADRDEVWPVGWPTTQPTHQTIPKLLDELPVEIADTPLSEVLLAIEPRLGVPLVIDRNGLAARGIDMDQIKIQLPATKTMYKKLLDRILFRARLELLIQVDDGDRPFLWIQPIRV